MSAKGDCYGKAFAETCFATIKAEMLPDSQIFESKLAGTNFTAAIFAALQQTTKHTPKLKHT